MFKPHTFYAPEGGGEGKQEPSEKPAGNTFTQEDVNNIVAKTKKEIMAQFGDYENLKSERQKLLDEKQQREEAELTEVEKLKNKQAEYEKQIADISGERDHLKSYKEEMEQKLTEQVEKAMEGLSDEDIAIVNALPLENRLSAVNRLKAVKPSDGNWGKGQGQQPEKDLKARLLAAKTPREREVILREEYRKN